MKPTTCATSPDKEASIQGHAISIPNRNSQASSPFSEGLKLSDQN